MRHKGYHKDTHELGGEDEIPQLHDKNKDTILDKGGGMKYPLLN